MSLPKKISAVIFDIDGTLVDSFPTFYTILNGRIRASGSVAISREFLSNCFKEGLNLGEILQRIFPRHVHESVIERRKKEILELFLKAEVDEIKPFPEVDKLFRNLKEKGIKIGVATGRMSPPEKEWERFKRYGLHPFIDSIVTSKDLEKRKPAPDLLIECAKMLNVSLEECLAVGDTEIDIIAARRAGAIPVAVLTGQDGTDVLAREKPQFLLKNIGDLANLLEEETGGA